MCLGRTKGTVPETRPVLMLPGFRSGVYVGTSGLLEWKQDYGFLDRQSSIKSFGVGLCDTVVDLLKSLFGTYVNREVWDGP